MADIRLRPLEIGDAELTRTWRNSERVSQAMFTNDYIEADQHLKWLERTLPSDTSRYWMIMLDGEPVGVVNLAAIDRRNNRASWAYYVGEEVGVPVGLIVEYEIMAIAFADMGLHRLTSEVLMSNEKVAQLHERMGFTREGVLREHIFKDDTYHDVIVLGITKPEWEKRHSKRPRLAKF